MSKFYVAFLAVLSLNVFAQFEQAYAPVRVGKSTVFIPIDLKPENSAQVWSMRIEDGYKLTWSRSQDADYYEVVYRYKDTLGQIKTDTIRVNGLNYTLKPKGTVQGAIQVRACHRYGCSSLSYTRPQSESQLILQALTTEQTSASSIKVSWRTLGATSVTLQEKIDNRVTSSTYGLSPSAGSAHVSIQNGQRKTVTIYAYGFDGNKVSRSVNLAGQFKDSTRTQGVKHDDYLQPFYQLNYSIVERSVLYTANSIYFATRDFKLYRFDKKDKINYKQTPTWVVNTDGMVANRPVLDSDSLYYTASYTPRSYVDGKHQSVEYSGQVCSLNVATTANAPTPSCTHMTTNVVASPVLVKQEARTFSNGFRLFSRSAADNAQFGLYVFGKDGQVKILDPRDIGLEIHSTSVPLNGMNQGVLATPEVYLSKNSNSKNQFVIKSGNKIRGIAVPNSNEITSQYEKSARALLQSVGIEFEQRSAEEKQVMQVLWEKEL
ncbi:hypothetical protein [Pseudoalteromonas rubra]|uniref:hypothetical protein n=1 Tax=Pseudoalteromonas rubra TaxID=43658 RepID=UPI00026CB26C|nr:hypothetical protein [Pseudoalteromonas rubra]